MNNTIEENIKIIDTLRKNIDIVGTLSPEFLVEVVRTFGR